jgi:hypothetical protein
VDVHKKVEDLISLALHESTPETEASEAARAACRLIRKHGLLQKPAPNFEAMFEELGANIWNDVTRKRAAAAAAAAPAPPPPQSTPTRSRPSPKTVEDVFEELFSEPVRNPAPRGPKRADPSLFVRRAPVTTPGLKCAKCSCSLPIATWAVHAKSGTYHSMCYGGEP